MSAADEPTLPGVAWDNATPLLYSVAYCSRAAQGMDDAGVDRIVATARRHNASHQITGMLVFGSGIFFQWLEGPRSQVRQLMAMLRTDARHHTLIELTEAEEVRERLFPDWSMERVTAEDISVVLADAKDSTEDAKQAADLALLLRELQDGQLSGLGKD